MAGTTSEGGCCVASPRQEEEAEESKRAEDESSWCRIMAYMILEKPRDFFQDGSVGKCSVCHKKSRVDYN